MKYRKNHNGDPVVDASPREAHALRPCVCAALRRHGCPEREIDDIAQHVEIVTWQAIEDGRVQGHDLENPRDALVMFMISVARNAFRNYRMRCSTWREIFPDEPIEAPTRSPVARIEARDILRRIGERPKVARFLLNAAIDVPRPERRDDAGMTEGTYYVRITKAQRWAREVATSGHWREPPQPTPASPRNRKKKR